MRPPALSIAAAQAVISCWNRCAFCHCALQAELGVGRPRLTCSPACRQAYRRLLDGNERSLIATTSSSKPRLLYLDPPWPWVAWSALGEARSPQAHYRIMSPAAIAALPIDRVAADHAVMALWVYDPILPWCIVIPEMWGFRYAGKLMTWSKRTIDGRPILGLGKSTRKNTESLYLFRRGRGLRRQRADISEFQPARRGRHSEKPHEVRQALENLYGDVDRLELFARERRPGWTSWGDQLPED